MEACNTINSCTDVGLACVCCLIALTLLVAASGAIFRLRATRSIVLSFRELLAAQHTRLRQLEVPG